jgi:hypothetical protein
MIGNDHVRFGPEAAGKELITSTSPAAYRCQGSDVDGPWQRSGQRLPMVDWAVVDQRTMRPML